MSQGNESQKDYMAHRPVFLKSAGSGSESATQIINHLNSLMKKYNQKPGPYDDQNSDKLVNTQKILLDHQRQGQFGIQKRNGVNGTLLETEETGFSAIEEEVKSNEMNKRPTVYAGMQTKLERNISGNGEDEGLGSLRGGRS